MNVKTGLLFIIFFCCFGYAGLAQYALQVGDQFIPIVNEGVISKQTLLSADTVRVMYLKPGSKELSQMKNVMVVTQYNGENTGAFLYALGVFGKEVFAKIEKMDGGRMLIGQYKVAENGTKESVTGTVVSLRLGP